MIPDKPGITVSSTVQGESIAMRIDTGALAHIMDVLTNLYEDRLMAAIREPATNARDAMLAAGKGDEPIRVELPTSLRPILSIIDQGVGMSADDIREVYSAYGASTKRGTDDFNGMLGLGCKAPLAYTDQFVVTSIKDGQRIVVSVARAEDGTGAMTVLQSGDTTDPNGTQIDIPIKFGNSLTVEEKAKEFFSYWEEETVLLNGRIPDRIEGEYIGTQFLVIPTTTHVYMRDRQDHMRMHVVMGGVRYPLPEGYKNKALEALPGGYALIAFVPIGTVMFTPSREGLQDTPQTIAALDGVMAEYAAELSELLEDTVTKADNPWSAAKAITDAKRKYGFVPPMEYKGRPIPDRVEFSDGARVWQAGRGQRHGFTLETAGYLHTVSLADALAKDVIWITKFTNKAWTKPMRRKFNAYAERELGMENADENYVLLTDADDVPARDWLGDATVIPWSDVREWKDPAKKRASAGSVKYAGTYPTIPALPADASEDDVRLYRECHPAAELQKSDAPIYYFANTKYNSYGDDAVKLLGRCNVCFIQAHRLDKFKKLYPEATSIGAAIREKLLRDWKRVSNDNRGAILHSERLHNHCYALKQMDPDALDDKRLARLVQIARHKVPEETRAKWARWWNYMPPGLKQSAGTIDVSVIDKYPLLDSITSYYADKINIAHLTLYLNAAYAAESEV